MAKWGEAESLYPYVYTCKGCWEDIYSRTEMEQPALCDECERAALAQWYEEKWADEGADRLRGEFIRREKNGPLG